MRNEIPNDVPSGLYLHIGCDTKKLKDFINVDIRKTKATDIVAECWFIPDIQNDSVSFIYSRHIIEHISLKNARKTFAHWFDLLKPRGMVNIVVPDIEFHAKQLLGLEKSNFPDQMQHACASIWGWQLDERGGDKIDSHLWGYTFETLKAELSQAGFIEIRRKLSGSDLEPWHLNITARKP